jgi:Ser/Thr protein kinase RdoA (MazF antagonist)
MDDTALSNMLLLDQYGVEQTALHLLSGSLTQERAVYRIDLPDEASWIVRAYRRDIPVPEWLGGCGTPDIFDWLWSRAQTLAYLQQQNYAAPRVVPTRTDKLVGEAQGWCTLVTIFIEGHVAQPTLQQLRLLGAALGKLHQVPLPDDVAIGKSWWYPEYAITSALAQLASVEHKVPSSWTPLYMAMRATLETAQQWAHIPRAVIHADAWAGNAVQTTPDQIVLIDWEPSGLGWPIVDLGRLLIQSPVDLSSALDALLELDTQRIHAVVDGYSQQRVPSVAELDTLLEAIRFTVAVGGAWHVAQGPQAGWHTIARRLARRQHRYDVSDAVAQIARQRFEHI